MVTGSTLAPSRYANELLLNQHSWLEDGTSLHPIEDHGTIFESSNQADESAVDAAIGDLCAGLTTAYWLE